MSVQGAGESRMNPFRPLIALTIAALVVTALPSVSQTIDRRYAGAGIVISSFDFDGQITVVDSGVKPIMELF